VDLPSHTPLPAEAVPKLDRFAHFVADRLDVPLALISLVDATGQVLPGAAGLPEPWLTERWTPLSHSFCQHVVAAGRPLLVENAHDDPVLSDNLAVMELGVVAYAGVPLRAGAGPVVGSVCAIDHRPRQWTAEQLADLSRIASACSAELGDL
jgi:GAF domain-containing protein